MKTKYLVSAAAAVILVGIGAVAFMAANDSDSKVATTSETEAETSANAGTGNQPPANGEAGRYTAYSPELVSQASAKQDVVLFFHAPWCPTCRGLDANIEQNLSQIPANLTILKVDYDTAEELKQKYDIVVQHTLVQVDSEGNLISKWHGSPTLEDIAAQVQ